MGWNQDAKATLILRTENGTDWNQVNHPARSGILYNVYFTDENSGWTVGADDFGGGAPIIFHTEDGGDNWQEQIHGLDHGGFSDVFFTSADTGFVTGGADTSAVMLRTIDRGENWTPVAIPGLTQGSTQIVKLANPFANNKKRIDRIDFVKANGMALVNNEREGPDKVDVWITLDGGQTWVPLGAPLEDGTAKGLELNDNGVAKIVGKRDGSPLCASVRVIPWELKEIEVIPSEVTLNVNEQQKFQAMGHYDSRDSFPVQATWSTTGGSIDSNTGLYTATTAGTFTVTASVQGSSVTGTANVHVIPWELKIIDVTPPEVTLNVNDQQQFLANGYDTQGNEIPITPAWSASGGSITPGGLYTATTVGDFIVTASVEDDSVTGTASVHVTSTGVLPNGELPDKFELFQNFPNPFNPETTIGFNVKITCHVSLKVVGLLGQEIAVLANSQFTPGMHEVKFDGQELPSGLYFYEIRMKGFYDIKKMLLLE
ncbi:Ig-like domain-containing protein [candidate division KSB1 bacterium]|nr:Ig-like domain-containing protein [candidate division KSB1 bacterium]